MKYYELTNGDFVETTLRPSPDDPAYKQKLCDHKYELGDGWCHIGNSNYIYHDGKWFVSTESSEACVLYVAYLLACKLGLQHDFESLCVLFCGSPWTQDDVDYAQQHTATTTVTIEDLPQILDDLTDINYHAFANRFEELVTTKLAAA